MSIDGKKNLRLGLILLLLPTIPFFCRKFCTNPKMAMFLPTSFAEKNLADQYRIQLIMALDLLVRSERVLQAETGVFTKSLGRVPDVLGSLTYDYRIDIGKATDHQFVVTAVKDPHSIQQISLLKNDTLSMNEHFKIDANFPIPLPPRDYLHVLAQTVMNQIFYNQLVIPEKQTLDLLEGAFRGFFRYEIKSVMSAERGFPSMLGNTVVAQGLKAPVEGDVIEMEPNANLYQWVYQCRQQTWLAHEFQNELDKIYLAEKIHQVHTGHYTSSIEQLAYHWNNLQQIYESTHPLILQEMQLDPLLGFQAELTEHLPSWQSQIWNVNGYKQMSEISSKRFIDISIEEPLRDIANEKQVDVNLKDKKIGINGK